MKFETILDAHAGAVIEVLNFYWDKEKDKSILERHRRQRDAFRARLVKMYKRELDDATRYKWYWHSAIRG